LSESLQLFGTTKPTVASIGTVWSNEANDTELKKAGSELDFGGSAESKRNHMSMEMSTKETGKMVRGVFKPVIALASLLVVNLAAQAAVDIGTDVSILGSKPASSQTPWINSLFTDIGPNTVRLTITAPNLTSSEFLQTLYLNFNDTKQVTSLVFTPVFSLWQGLSTAYSLGLNQNNFQAGSAGGDFDIQLGFQTSGGLSSQFNHGDTVVFDITTKQNTSLSSMDFAFQSYNGHHPPLYYEAAYLGGISGNKTGWVAADTFNVSLVPEPTSGFTAAACCFVGLAGLRRAKNGFCGLFA
jgi:hypothetical protein